MAKSNRQKSGLLLAGAAAGVALAWLGRRRSSAATIQEGSLASEDLQTPVAAASAELPLGPSADPTIDHELSRKHLPQNDTSGASLFGDEAPDSTPADSLDDLWRAVPDLAASEELDGYDATAPEDLGAVWLERATETEPDPRTPPLESGIPPELEGVLMSEGSINAAHELEQLEDSDDIDAALEQLQSEHRADVRQGSQGRPMRSPPRKE